MMTAPESRTSGGPVSFRTTTIVVLTAGLGLAAIALARGMAGEGHIGRAVDVQGPVSGGVTLLQQTPTETHFSTEVDELADARTAAMDFARSSPETGDPQTVISTVAGYLSHVDPVIRTAGAASLGRIGMSPVAYTSGLLAAVRNDQSLVAALFDTAGYWTSSGYDDIEMRSTAVQAMSWLWRDEPNAAVESTLVDLYWEEIMPEVRFVIVGAMCELEYTTTGVESVLQDAQQSQDGPMVARAQACLAELFPH